MIRKEGGRQQHAVPPHTYMMSLALIGCGTLMMLLSVRARSRDSSAQGVPAWTTVEEVRIPSAGTGYLLSKVFDIKIGPSGSIYVGDELEPCIFMFDAHGQFVGRFGRRGYGPGEFQHPKTMGWLGDTLWVTDDDILRVSYFDAAGTLIETARISGPAIPPGLPTVPDYFLADGSVTLEQEVGSRQIAKTHEVTAIPVLRMTRQGRVLDTLALLPVGLRVVRLPVTENRDMYSRHPVPLTPFWAASPKGEFLVSVDLPQVSEGSHGSVRIVFYRPDGSVSHSVQYPFKPLRLSAAVADSIIEYRARALASMHVPGLPPLATLRKRMKKQTEFPAFLPPVTALVLGRDSTVWLRREDVAGEPRRWDVLDWSGRAIGRLEVPRGITIFEAQRTAVWGTSLDKDGVPQVVSYRVVE